MATYGSVDELRFFSVVAGSETLTAASRELGCSLPVVSKRLSALEARLGVKLVQRGTRRLVLTSEGATYAHRIGRILSDVQELEETISGADRELRGTVNVEATLGLGRAHIAPLLGQFSSLHRGLEARLFSSALPLRPHRRQFDVAIHVGLPAADSGLRLRRLASNRRVLCGAPSYIRLHGRPETVDDLSEHDCIVLRENESDFALWRFGDEGNQRRVRVEGSLSSNDGDIVVGWAAEGRGLMMRSQWHVQRYLDTGELIELLPDVPTPAADIYALYDDTHHVPRRVLDLIDYLGRELPKRVAPGASQAARAGRS